MKRKEQKASTRARVLSAARDSFGGKDVRDVAMTDIAKTAGISVGAVYVHFPSREALIDAVFEELQGRVLRAMRQTLVATEEANVAEAIDRLAAAYLREMRDLRPFASLYAAHMAHAMSADILRSGGSVAPFLQMVSATFVTLAPMAPVETDLATFATSLVSLWRGAALGYVTRPLRDEAEVAGALAKLTQVLLRGAAPKLFDLDARVVARHAAQFLKEKPRDAE